ncbi:MAG: hypothetical protein K2L05_00595, partial [Muribaculaceae bacterium]|nr:hypothetical protein [Muribaculaceae bacterium]
LLLLLLLAACGRSPQAQLHQADALMETHPDSAMALLSALDRAHFSAADSAYFALLYTQAQIKTDVYLTSDSLISTALHAYRFSTDPDLRRRAHFYAAQVAYRQRNYRDAMRNAVVAYDISLDSANPYWTAKTAELLSDLYNEAYNYEQSTHYSKIAVKEYLKAGYVRNHRFALCDLANQYTNRGMRDSAFATIDSVMTIIHSQNPVDSALLNYATRSLLSAQWFFGDYGSLNSTLESYHHATPELEEELSYAIIAGYAASNAGDSIGYSSFMLRAYSLADNEKDLLPALYVEYKDAISRKDYERALALSDSIILMQCSVADELLDESMTAIQSDYYASQKSLEQERNLFMRRLIIIISVSSIIAIVLLLIIYSQRLKAARADIQYNLKSIHILKAQSVDNTHLIESLFADKWSIINTLSKAYYEKGESDHMLKHIVADIKNVLETISTPESISEILATTDKCADGIITSLRSECTFLKEQDIEFIGLIYAGLSVRSICYICRIKKYTFYQKKNRLMRRIAESDAAHKDTFVELVNHFTP